MSVVLAAAACTRGEEIDAPPPLAVEDSPDTLGPIVPSIVEADVRYDLTPAIAALDRVVPRRFGDITQRLDVKTNKRVHVAFAATRSPFRVRVEGARVSITTTVEYEGRGWYKPPIGPEVSAACGTGAVPKPRARVRLTSQFQLTPAWALDTKSRITAVEPVSTDERDKCRVTIFRVDVTERVMTATRDLLSAQLRELDRALAAVKTKDRFSRWWRDISRPIRLTDSVWFTINPSAVRLAGLRTDSADLVVGLQLTASPRLLTGNRPNDFDLFTNLPPLGTAQSTGGKLEVTLDGSIDYPLATGLLQRALAGKEIPIAGRTLRIQSVELLGVGGGRLALGVRFVGDIIGMVYFVGTPRYDPAADQLLVPDLAYDLRTSDLLVRSVAWLKDDAIRDFLRTKARFPLTGQLDKLRELAIRGMNRDLAEGVRLVATLDRAAAVEVAARRAGIRVRAQASGSAQLDIDKPLTVAKTRRRQP